VPGAVYSQDFTQGLDAPAQCEAWQDYFNNQLVSPSYTAVTVSGTFDPIGTTCSDPSTATQICQALHTGSFTSLFCDGHLWNVGSCAGSPELSVDASVCFCEFEGSGAATVRPCVGFTDWGGVKTETCDGPSQNMTVICQ
jgi:hypothetical protein